MNPTSPNSPRFIWVFTEKFEKYENRNIQKMWTNVLKHIEKGVTKLMYWSFFNFSRKTRENLRLFMLVGFRKGRTFFF